MTSRVTSKGEEGTPGLQLHLVDSDDEPVNEGPGGERRPSTASLSRFRSCPQLSTADGHLPDSPESDDLGLGPELLVTHVHFTQGSPRQQRPPRRETTAAASAGREEATPPEGRTSQTPTPPSTPGSRRSHVSMKETLCAVVVSGSAGGVGGGGGGGVGPGSGGAGNGSAAARGACSTPDGGLAAAPLTSRRVDRARLEHARLGRTASQDSPAAAHVADPSLALLRHRQPGPPPVDDDEVVQTVHPHQHHHHTHHHLRSGGDQGSERGSSRVVSEFFDEPPDISIEDRLTCTEDGASTPGGGGERGPRYHGDPDSMDKCARWLQSLKMTTSDRLKSRSHIQLPPI